MEVKHLIETLGLLPHPEGGYYKETYRSSEQSNFAGFEGERNYCTGIYFLIEKNNFSALHRIKSDEMWHFYGGDPLEVIEITLNGELKITRIGNTISEGEVPQYLVPKNHWFGSRVKKGGNFSFVGCTVAPGFDFNDFEMAERKALCAEFPQHAVIIEELTRN
ncbi:MAG: cupin domain-containing protein [Bacteroidia bacterium]|nr:cupin domain-containing protein [Bacteroidia bacterium]